MIRLLSAQHNPGAWICIAIGLVPTFALVWMICFSVGMIWRPGIRAVGLLRPAGMLQQTRDAEHGQARRSPRRNQDCKATSNHHRTIG